MLNISLSFSKIPTKWLPEGLDEVQICELMQVNESLKNFDVEIIPVDQT